MSDKNRQKNFIKTSDVETKELLIKEGFELISEDNGIYTFLNTNPSCKFSDNKNSNILFSNKMFI